MQKDYKKAAEAYREASLEDPANYNYKFYLASALDYIGEREEAVNILEEITEDDIASVPEAYNYLGYIYAEEGKNLDRAIFLINKALKEDPDNGAYLDSLGWTYYKKGMLDEAEEMTKKALHYLSDDAVIREHLGDIHYKKGNYKRVYHRLQPFVANELNAHTGDAIEAMNDFF